jgi:hypothetical protein
MGRRFSVNFFNHNQMNSSILVVSTGNKRAGIALSYGLDDLGFESRQRLRVFLFTTVSRPALGPN